MIPRLGVNIDHIATLRQVRGEFYPDPAAALKILKSCGASQVTLHWREDGRHVQQSDVVRAINAKILPVNLEIALSASKVDFAIAQKPKMVTLVPERRQEITTEGGLNCRVHRPKRQKLKQAIERMKNAGIHVSLFVAPQVRQIQAAVELGADAVELHAGQYCHAVEQACLSGNAYRFSPKIFRLESVAQSLDDLELAARFADAAGLKVYAGHGLHKLNLSPVARLGLIEEYNIGHAIIARAVFVGLKAAILEIQRILRRK